MQMPFEQVAELAIFNGVQAMNTLGQLQQAVQANQGLAQVNEALTAERDAARKEKQDQQAELDQVRAELEALKNAIPPAPPAPVPVPDPAQGSFLVLDEAPVPPNGVVADGVMVPGIEPMDDGRPL